MIYRNKNYISVTPSSFVSSCSSSPSENTVPVHHGSTKHKFMFSVLCVLCTYIYFPVCFSVSVFWYDDAYYRIGDLDRAIQNVNTFHFLFLVCFVDYSMQFLLTCSTRRIFVVLSEVVPGDEACSDRFVALHFPRVQRVVDVSRGTGLKNDKMNH
jgi:hypothetical protein